MVKAVKDNNRWFIALLIILAVSIVVAASQGSSNQDSASSDASSSESNGPPAEQRCVDLWNADTGSYGPQFVGNSHLAGDGDVYGSVGFAADYPNLCLWTIANPSKFIAYQWLETDGAVGAVQVSTPNELPESVKDWNLLVDIEAGQISLNSGE